LLYYSVRAFKCIHERFSHSINVAGAQRQRHVPSHKCSDKSFYDLASVRNKLNIQVALSLDRLIERLPGYTRRGILPRRVNFRQNEPVGAFKSGQEIFKKIPGPAITVRLEDYR